MKGDADTGEPGYPCALKGQVERAGGAMTVCLPDLATHPEISEAYRRAIVDGDLEALAHINADALAGMHALHRGELRKLLDEGLREDVPIVDKWGDVVGSRPLANPRSFPFLELSKLVGVTADQQAATPKARGETQRAVSEAQHLEWMRTQAGRFGSPAERPALDPGDPS